MKITLNLSPAASARDRFALAWAVPATLIGLLALVLLGRASRTEYRDFRGFEQQLTEVQARSDDLRNQEASIRSKLAYPAYRELYHRAHFVNQLIKQKEFSFAELSARVAGLLPDEVSLTGLALASPKKPGDDYLVRMSITAKNEDAVETFINDLVDAPDFKEVSILNQGFQIESSQPDQVNVICTARYLPGVDINAGKTSEEESAPNRKSNH
jgi:hypothetical protein